MRLFLTNMINSKRPKLAKDLRIWMHAGMFAKADLWVDFPDLWIDFLLRVRRADLKEHTPMCVL